MATYTCRALSIAEAGAAIRRVPSGTPSRLREPQLRFVGVQCQQKNSNLIDLVVLRPAIQRSISRAIQGAGEFLLGHSAGRLDIRLANTIADGSSTFDQSVL